MILTKDQIKDFEDAARPLIKYLNTDIFNPHVTVIVTCARADLSEGVAGIVIEDYVTALWGIKPA